ncbi:WecB/TagA/CpsF family glycosyltransferase [Photobacterium carnosum]|uniref:WecB/TagA/CpsF family glycosyltransferase n=1 Tax=Photobacterium carnosum TaxID=2023717 RepID=UPI001E55DBB1|nr:WecB/TagA/CpsF family glycosyltransferase [Photobacterium carnosum]MCD9529736.1 WecB/TagA/CpsF family glycosyltransferase [Photobacterium carnosum]MCD9545315.1 WecB/TagA/CpsF family glycosyltransferase [Photobacterium carnosum]MCD9552974.1 WecB/TagA/CpsF family glycosyltransferase [Photobacterium carnosum]MCF2155312.1 WecB/TagA/CpsF family glycosyltransferase [Photobacterium carnosum]MCF2217129.1 WecB/TagA/CpsF family glycosyltransferase [Photobacterium carnosum]
MNRVINRVTITDVSILDRLIALLYSVVSFPVWVCYAIQNYSLCGRVLSRYEYCCGFDYRFCETSRLARLLAVVKGDLHLIGYSPKIAYSSDNQYVGAFSARDIHENLGIKPIEYHHLNDDVELKIYWWKKCIYPLLYAYSLLFKVVDKPINQRIKWFGIEVFNGHQNVALKIIQQLIIAIPKKHPSLIGYVNADCLNKLKDNHHYRENLSKFNLVLPDGVGLKWALKLKGILPGDNINGTDFSPKILELAAQKNWSVFFLGGERDISKKALTRFKNIYPKLNIAGSHHGFFENDQLVIDYINKSKAQILFVGFGTPIQEQWVVDNYKYLSVNIVICVGGMFDFYAGKVRRAPLLIRQVGFEWLYRLYQEPKRLWNRYVVGNANFIFWNVSHALDIRMFCLNFLSRTIDVVISLIALMIWAPFHTILYCLLFITERKNPIFKQVRVGKNGQRFTMYKYTTMDNNIILDEEEFKRYVSDGIRYKNKLDPRITKFGFWLRKFSVDEIPQFLNVLKGEMKLVGPRPALEKEVEKYTQVHKLRLLIKPGMTGLWQISGRSELSCNKQFELDLHYVVTRNIMLDLLILIKTVPAVLSARGAM